MELKLKLSHELHAKIQKKIKQKINDWHVGNIGKGINKKASSAEC